MLGIQRSMELCINRIHSYGRRWKHDFITYGQLVIAGLYYTGYGDCVRCAYCKREFNNWRFGDDPTMKHKKLSPECPYFKLTPMTITHGACYPIFKNLSDYHKHMLIYLHLINNVRRVSSPLITVEERLETFDNCNNMQLLIIAEKLSVAGFHYSTNGVKEEVLCSFCSINVFGVPLQFEPMVVHAQMSGSCIFVLLNVGTEFVESAERWAEQNGPVRNLSQLVADHNAASTIENRKSDVHRMKRKLLSFYKQNESVPESMLCKICYINKVAIAFLPCKHTIACFECALKLDTCGICRTPFYAMKADIYEDPEEKKNYQLLSSPSQSSNDDSSQKLLCKLCGKKERNISFLPCFHIYGCSNCANFFSNCPVCRVHIEFAMQVYL